MSKHTPGPWKAIRYDSANSKGERITGFYIGCNADDQGFHKIANIEIEEHSSGGRYNSDLIAAAPDLLEALEAMVEYVDRMHAIGHIQRPAQSSEAYAAIAKAKGYQP